LSFKNLTYALLGIIFFLLILLSFSYFNAQEKHKNEKTNIDKLISDFETKFYNDSITLANNNAIYLDKMTQNIIDSIVLVYEKKLKLAFTNYKLESSTNNNSLIQEDDLIYAAINSNDITPKTQTSNSLSNVTSYSKLDNYISKSNYLKSTNFSSNVTSYSKLKTTTLRATKNTSNVTTYSKLKNTTRASKKINNVTTYNKLKHNSRNIKPKKQTVLNQNTRETNNNLYLGKQNSNLVYSNSILNNAVNFNDIEVSPIYPGCENKYSERDKKNCFATKLSNYVLDNFNATNFNKTNLKKGYNNVRVLFVIDNKGNSKVGKIVGKWPQNVKTEINRVIHSTPKMTPGKYHNNAISVKYSFKIPFLIK